MSITSQEITKWYGNITHTSRLMPEELQTIVSPLSDSSYNDKLIDLLRQGIDILNADITQTHIKKYIEDLKKTYKNSHYDVQFFDPTMHVEMSSKVIYISLQFPNTCELGMKENKKTNLIIYTKAVNGIERIDTHVVDDTDMRQVFTNNNTFLVMLHELPFYMYNSKQHITPYVDIDMRLRVL